MEGLVRQNEALCERIASFEHEVSAHNREVSREHVGGRDADLGAEQRLGEEVGTLKAEMEQLRRRVEEEKRLSNDLQAEVRECPVGHETKMFCFRFRWMSWKRQMSV